MNKSLITAIAIVTLAVSGIGTGYAATPLNEAEGSIAGIVHLYTISDYNGGDIIYEQTPCFGCFVVAKETMTISSENGRFLLTGIPVGDYALRVSYETCITGSHDDYSSPTFSITKASPNYNFKSPIPMYESRGTISGVARLQDQAMHSNIVVTVEGLAGYVTTTDAQGNYTLPSVPARTKRYKLVFTKSGYAPVSITDVLVHKDIVTPLAGVKLTSLSPHKE